MMLRRSGDRGQTLVFAILAMPMIIGMVGLAVDVGYLRQTKRTMQTAADSAAVAGALALLNNSSTITSTAKSATAFDGFTDGSNGVAVTVNNPPLYGPHAGNSTYVETIITQGKPPLFTGVVGAGSVTVAARAVAWAGASSKNCMYALGSSGTSLLMNGSNTINASCGIVIDSNGSSALTLNGSNTIADKYTGIVGGDSLTGSNSVTPAAVTGIPPTGDPLASLPTPAITAACTGTTYPGGTITGGITVTVSGTHCYNITINGSGNNVTLSPGDYGNVTINGSGNIVTLGAGQYGNVSNNGSGGTLTFNPGQFSSLVDNGSPIEVFDSGLYVITGVPGGGGLILNGSTGSSGSGVTFYLGPSAGAVTINGSNSASFGDTLTAPGSGSYAGVLIFQDRSNSNSITMNGSNSATLNGAIYAPDAQILMNGSNSSSSTCDILLAASYVMNGSNTITLNNSCPSLVGGSPIKTAALVE